MIISYRAGVHVLGMRSGATAAKECASAMSGPVQLNIESPLSIWGSYNNIPKAIFST